jgi:HSP20 family protein
VEPHWSLETEELENEYVVRAEVTGFAPSELNVNLTGNCSRSAPYRGEQTENPTEPPSGWLERTITMPVGIKPEGVTAVYGNGVLEVHLPKSAEALTGASK